MACSFATWKYIHLPKGNNITAQQPLYMHYLQPLGFRHAWLVWIKIIGTKYVYSIPGIHFIYILLFRDTYIRFVSLWFPLICLPKVSYFADHPRCRQYVHYSYHTFIIYVFGNVEYLLSACV